MNKKQSLKLSMLIGLTMTAKSAAWRAGDYELRAALISARKLLEVEQRVMMRDNLQAIDKRIKAHRLNVFNMTRIICTNEELI